MLFKYIIFSLFAISCTNTEDFFTIAKSGKLYHRLNLPEFLLLVAIYGILLYFVIKLIRRRK